MVSLFLEVKREVNKENFSIKMSKLRNLLQIILKKKLKVIYEKIENDFI